MKVLLAGLVAVILTVAQAQAADNAQSAPKPAQPVQQPVQAVVPLAQAVAAPQPTNQLPVTSYGKYYLQSGWYLMAPADANRIAQTATTNAQELPVAKAIPAGTTPVAAPAVAAPAATTVTIRIRSSATPAVTTQNNSESVWDESETGNNSGSGDLGSMR